MDRCTTESGDMSSAVDLDRLVQAIGKPIDIVIDDASQSPITSKSHWDISYPACGREECTSSKIFIGKIQRLRVKERQRHAIFKGSFRLSIFRSPFLTEQQCRYIVEIWGHYGSMTARRGTLTMELTLSPF